MHILQDRYVPRTYSVLARLPRSLAEPRASNPARKGRQPEANRRDVIGTPIFGPKNIPPGNVPGAGIHPRNSRRPVTSGGGGGGGGGPSVDSTNSVVGLRSRDFSTSSPPAKLQSPNYHRARDNRTPNCCPLNPRGGSFCVLSRSHLQNYLGGRGSYTPIVARCAVRNVPQGAAPLRRLIPHSHCGLPTTKSFLPNGLPRSNLSRIPDNETQW